MLERMFKEKHQSKRCYKGDVQQQTALTFPFNVGTHSIFIIVEIVHKKIFQCNNRNKQKGVPFLEFPTDIGDDKNLGCPVICV